VRQKAVKWPRGVCCRGVGSNSLQCTSCQKWAHKKCNGIKGSMSKMMKSGGCLNMIASAGRTSVDIGAIRMMNRKCKDRFQVKDRFPSKELKDRLGHDTALALQAAMV